MKATPAQLLDKHFDTIRQAVEHTHALAGATKAIESAKELQAKAMDGIKLCIKAMRSDKITLGKSRRTCAYSSAYHDMLGSLGVTAKTADTYLSAFRFAVNEGRPFTLNPSRAGITDKRATAIVPNGTKLTELPPAPDSKAGQAVHVHTSDTVREVLAQDGNNGPDVRVAPNAKAHNQLSEAIQKMRPNLELVFLLLGNLHMKTNQDAIAAIREELSRIESEVLEAAK